MTTKLRNGRPLRVKKRSHKPKVRAEAREAEKRAAMKPNPLWPLVCCCGTGESCEACNV